VKYAYIDLNIKEPVLYKLVPILVETMGDVFPEIGKQQSVVEKIIKAEEESFGATLERGMTVFESYAGTDAGILTPGGGEVEGFSYGTGEGITAEAAFFLYDTCGFPLDLTELLARERGIAVDVVGFNELMQQQKTRARDARKSVSQEAVNLKVEGGTEFVGYTEPEAEAHIIGVAAGGVVLDRSPFYAEMGGQLADHGELVISGERYHVSDVQKVGDAFLHLLEEDVDLKTGETVLATIDLPRRAEIQRHHSATHILHEALRRVLGTHVQQAGSLVAPDHLRFDFSHFNKLSEEELRDIEQMVNDKIREGITVVTEELPIEQARKIPNVKMFFGDKYGSKVRVVTIDPAFSAEFCGGTHVVNTADIGMLKLISEGSIQSGVRRMEAITGRSADELLLRRYEEVERLSRRLGVSDRELYEKVEALLEEKKMLEKELAKVQLASAAGGLDQIIASAHDENGVKVASGRVAASDMEALKSLGDDLRNRLKSGIGLLGAEIDGKAALVCVVTDDLVKRYSAGKIVGAAAKLVGGGGGGKPHLATAGGKEVEKLDEALAAVPQLVQQAG
jgi:alanyl-tRNA synthetase